MSQVGLRSGKMTAIFLGIVCLVGVAFLVTQPGAGRTKALSTVVASQIEISHDFTECSIVFVNEGNVTDTTRSVLLFYAGAGSAQSIVRNADPSPDLTIAPGGKAAWDCTFSFAGSPAGGEGEPVNVVVSAVISRERATVSSFT